MLNVQESKKIYMQAKNEFLNKDYKGVINTTENNLNNPNITINPLMLYYCGVAYQELGNIDKALKYFEASIKAGGNTSLKVSIARRLHDTKYAINGIKYLQEAVLDPNYKENLAFFLLGKRELYQGNNERALELFERALKFAIDEQSKSKINNYIAKTKTRILMGSVSIDYDFSKELGFKLEPGQIVYLKQGTPVAITTSIDHPMGNLPFLIFHIDDETVYAFPLLSDNSMGYLRNRLRSSDTGLSYDRYVVTDIASFNTQNIRKVSGTVKKDVFKQTMNEIYKFFCHQKTSELTPNKISFLNLFGSKLKAEVYDIITFINSESRNEKYFFITEINEDYYIGHYLEVVGGMYTIASDQRLLDKNTIAKNVITPHSNIQNMLLSEIGVGRH